MIRRTAEALLTLSGPSAEEESELAQYFVIMPDGSKFGPADTPTLNQWIVEGRVHTTTILEEVPSGIRCAANQLPTLRFARVEAFLNEPAPDMIDDGKLLPGAVQGGFNLGALLIAPVWALKHGIKLGYVAGALAIISVLPLVAVFGVLGLVGISLYLAVNGNAMAWESGKYATVEECLRMQHKWAYWGLGTVIAAIAVFAVLTSFVF